MSTESEAKVVGTLLKALVHTATNHEDDQIVVCSPSMCPEAAVIVVGEAVWAEIQALGLLDSMSLHPSRKPN